MQYVVNFRWNADGLSEPAKSLWAKSPQGRHGSSWMPWFRHSADAAEVAAHLFLRFLPVSVRRLIAEALPGGEPDALALTALVAALHDIGKATPSFAFALGSPSMVNRMEGAGFTARQRALAIRRDGRHELTGMIIFDEWLRERHGWDPDRTRQLSAVVGGHHGIPPSEHQYRHATDNPLLLGRSRHDTPLWAATQNELLDWAAASVGADTRLADWAEVELPQPVQVLLTGLVVMADNIVSNHVLFPYRTDTVFDSDRIVNGVGSLNLPRPWIATAPVAAPDLLATRFGIESDEGLRPMQKAVLDAASSVSEPALMIVEAAMGSGKTEAAFLAAEALAARFGAGGIFYALPTQASADAIFARELEWAVRLPGAAPTNYSIGLAHARAHHNSMFTSLFKRGTSAAIAQDHDADERELNALITHWWSSGRKTSFLFNNFVIGTIDQLLFTALRVRHLPLRHLALAGKVVIVDEAHAYDVYMGEYLDKAIEWLASYGASVIILSATLPARRRRELVQAYERGRTGPPPPIGRRTLAPPPSEAPHPELDGDIGYPTIVTAHPGKPADIRTVKESGRTTRIEVRTLDDRGRTKLIAALREELADGGCALVLHNTVARVHKTAEALRTFFGAANVTVAHSRFTAPDRAENDQLLRSRFGPPGSTGERTDRPTKHIVVASQVAEQSLDLDFDVLFTDMAPADLVLQRMGRLHRHHRPWRDRPARCYLIGADWTADIPRFARGSNFVYDQWTLLRSTAVLLPFAEDREPLELPRDISRLVQEAYGDREIGPDRWQEALKNADHERRKKQQRKREDARQFRIASPGRPGEDLMTWLTRSSPISDDESNEGRAIVRDIPVDVVEVLLVARDGDEYSTLPWLPDHLGRPIPVTEPPEEDVAKTIAATTLSLPIRLSGDAIRKEIKAQQEPIGEWSRSPFLTDQLILAIDLAEGTDLGDHHLHYDRRDGLRVWKRWAPDSIS
ncbi:CRISPR-associated helicase/endonuclease Cas3 [Glycomyces endophyticus]|uniref:CRISPR-associated helicase/endonuclease Cas3 n=1 Tax=Glycomyces endophyticus TaxID=480996 RepID=A0ABP4RQV7_9ACTN